MAKRNFFYKDRGRKKKFLSFSFPLLGYLATEVLHTIYHVAVRPWVQGSCRFYPSCSVYAKTAFQILPFLQACYLTVWRLLRCHPWGALESDPLPSLSQTRYLCKNSKKT